MRRRLWLLLWVILVTVGVLSACDGCRPAGTTTPNEAAAGEPPTARLFLLSDVAGALEPCGCVKDQLGGMDHFGALVAESRGKVKAFATVSAGPLFFMDADLGPEKKAQEIAKAETIAKSLESLGLAAFTPGRNEWAGGPETLARLRDTCGAPMLAANVQGAAGAVPWVVRDIGGFKLGVVGVAAPEKVDGVSSTAPIAAVKEAAAAARKGGAQAVVVSAAVGRGEAKRIADEVPDLLAIVVGSTSTSGEVNTHASPAERIGEVLVVQPANHLQTVAVLDLFVRDAKNGGPVKFADGTGIDRIKKREELSTRIDELREKIATWENDKSVDAKDIAARKADLAKLETERDALDKTPPPATGSFYRYAMRDIRENLGADEKVKAQMLAYYKKVNDENKVAFADKKPPAPPKGEPRYVGVEACTNCHEEPRKVWDQTKHAHAYETLTKQFKEYNLDCVSCHVTGYDKPGGSTVTHVSDLKDVQCEVCHGPGEFHAAKPEKVHTLIPKPSADSCVSCHHPPHVHAFDAKAKMAEILGPGHGKPAP